jgi:hypothetical protein
MAMISPVPPPDNAAFLSVDCETHTKKSRDENKASASGWAAYMRR